LTFYRSNGNNNLQKRNNKRGLGRQNRKAISIKKRHITGSKKILLINLRGGS